MTSVSPDRADARTDPEPLALQVEGLSHAFGARQALDQVGFAIAPGEFTVLLGQNGAGKTTLFNLVTRLYNNRNGSIRVFGFDVLERCRATTVKIKTAEPGPFGQHFLFALPKCKSTTQAIRKWPNNPHGLPSRGSSYAHLGDCVTYPIHRLFTRRHRPKRGKKPRTVRRFNRRKQMRAF